MWQLYLCLLVFESLQIIKCNMNCLTSNLNVMKKMVNRVLFIIDPFAEVITCQDGSSRGGGPLDGRPFCLHDFKLPTGSTSVIPSS